MFFPNQNIKNEGKFFFFYVLYYIKNFSLEESNFCTVCTQQRLLPWWSAQSVDLVIGF